jgi:hypothetical protein
MRPALRAKNFTKVAVSGAPFRAEERRAPELIPNRSPDFQKPNKPSP